MPREFPGIGQPISQAGIEKLQKLYEYDATWFSEKTSVTENDCEYSRTNEDQGLVLIFNHVNFEDSDIAQRLGSNQDVNNIVSTLSKMGYNINVSNDVFTDYSKKQILDGIENQTILKGDNSKRNCLIVIFLSHGNNNNEIYATDGTLIVDEIIHKISGWNIFRNKPKLFIFQACKGKNLKYAPGDDHFTMTISLPPDVVVYFSSVEDKVSYRIPETGTWLIDELCKNVLMYGKKEDVVSILHRTSKCVASLQTTIDKSNEIGKQMPVVVSNLCKTFYFTNSKEKINKETAVTYFQNHKSVVDELWKQVQQLN